MNEPIFDTSGQKANISEAQRIGWQTRTQPDKPLDPAPNPLDAAITKMREEIPAAAFLASKHMQAFCERNGLPAPSQQMHEGINWVVQVALANALNPLQNLPTPDTTWAPYTSANREKIKKEFQKLFPGVMTSTGIHEATTFGSGELDPYGFWEGILPQKRKPTASGAQQVKPC